MRDLIKIIEAYYDYPGLDIFWLPTSKINFYDDPEHGPGDDGWYLDDLFEEIKKDREIKSPLVVGKSVHQMALNDHTVYCFNGNHRLWCAKKLGFEFVPCENVDHTETEDGEPITLKEIDSLGGSH